MQDAGGLTKFEKVFQGKNVHAGQFSVVGKTGQLKFSIAFSVSSYIRRSFVITSHHRTQDRKQMYVDFVVDTFFYVVLVIILTLFFFHQIRLSILTVPLCQRRFQIKSSTTKIPCYG